QPGASLAAAAHHHSVAAGLVHHLQSVLGGPDVAVAEHGDVGDQLLELGDRLPAGGAGIVLDDGAAVQGDRRRADLLGDQPGVAEGLVLVVDADAGLDGDGHLRTGGLDRGGDDAGEELRLPGQHAAAAAAGDLGDRAA